MKKFLLIVLVLAIAVTALFALTAYADSDVLTQEEKQGIYTAYVSKQYDDYANRIENPKNFDEFLAGYRKLEEFDYFEYYGKVGESGIPVIGIENGSMWGSSMFFLGDYSFCIAEHNSSSLCVFYEDKLIPIYNSYEPDSPDTAYNMAVSYTHLDVYKRQL